MEVNFTARQLAQCLIGADYYSIVYALVGEIIKYLNGEKDIYRTGLIVIGLEIPLNIVMPNFFLGEKIMIDLNFAFNTMMLIQKRKLILETFVSDFRLKIGSKIVSEYLLGEGGFDLEESQQMNHWFTRELNNLHIAALIMEECEKANFKLNQVKIKENIL